MESAFGPRRVRRSRILSLGTAMALPLRGSCRRCAMGRGVLCRHAPADPDCPSLCLDYTPPSASEILPLALLSPSAQQLVEELAVERGETGVAIFETASIFTWSTWISISRAFSELALKELQRVPFYALEPDTCPPYTNNTPYERVEVWQRVDTEDLSELEGDVSTEEKLQWIHERLCRARELETRAARAKQLETRIRWLSCKGLAARTEERQRCMLELDREEELELQELQENQPRLLRLRQVLLEAQCSDSLGAIPERLDTRWPFSMGWLGCKASWPTSQQFWWTCIACGIHQSLAMSMSFIVIVFEVVLLDAILVQDFVARVPNEIQTWGEMYAADEPLTGKLATIGSYLFSWLFVVGLLFEEERQPSLFGGYYNRIVASRVLLRTMGGRYEGQTYSYFTSIAFAIITEFHTVVIPSYLPFVAPTVLLQYYDGVLFQISKIYIIFIIVTTTQRFLLSFLQFVLCLTVSQAAETERFAVGSRVPVELRSMSFIYLWVTGITNVGLIGLMKYRMAMAYLWIIPISVIIYSTTLLALPYCIHGPRVCAPHSGPCLSMSHLLTTIGFLLFFFIKYGCFLFPCLCAPEIPAWLFFPPSDGYEPPIKGAFDSYAITLAISKMFELVTDPQRAWAKDCGWYPAESARLPREVLMPLD